MPQFLISSGFPWTRTCSCNSQRVSQMWTRVWKLLPWRPPASRRPASRRSRLRWTLLRVNPGNPDGADASRRSRSRWTYWCFWWCCQDTGRYIGKLLRDMWWCLKIMVKVNFGWQWWYRYDDASGHSWSRWPLITRSLTTCWLPRWDCSLWRRTFNVWLPCGKLWGQRFVTMTWNILPPIFKWSWWSRDNAIHWCLSKIKCKISDSVLSKILFQTKVGLMVDSNHAHSVPTAIRLAK